MTAFDSISLRSRDRALCVGGTESGKSTLCAGSMDYPFSMSLCGQFMQRYPDAQLAIADTKPRFRAAFNSQGVTDTRRYRDWNHGPVIPGSTRIDPWDLRGMDNALRTSRIIIVQTDAVDRDAGGVVACLEHFRKGVNRKHRRIIFVDECMDFYTQMGTPLRNTGNVILRYARAGAEREITTLLAAQRCKGIPPQLWELINKLYLFRMDKLTDMERIEESGAPVRYRANYRAYLHNDPPVPGTLWPPEENRRFVYWTKLARRSVWGPYTLPVHKQKRAEHAKEAAASR